ncbi:hypothetical protein EB796_001319 [Bugula neritina]|uniref:Uncharacterized protein n=1 Tax=Bugula neritina TaxID=10212 RepID=A0A7J7KQC8_BUGNE|nr:hypothetical protein EB796_001319 [Bugula neritina]
MYVFETRLFALMNTHNSVFCCRLLTGAITAILWLPCLLLVTDAPLNAVNYFNWLTRGSGISDLISYPVIADSLPNIPVEVEIKLETQISVSTTTFSTTTPLSGSKECSTQSCWYPTCAHSKPNSLSTYMVSEIQYQVSTLDGGYLLFNTSLPECGIAMTGSGINITKATGECNTALLPQQVVY